MHYPHEWGPHSTEPGRAVCLWCHRPFSEVGGTLCPLDPAQRAEAVELTIPLPVLPPAPLPRAERLTGVILTIAALLSVAVLMGVGVLALLHSPACS